MEGSLKVICVGGLYRGGDVASRQHILPQKNLPLFHSPLLADMSLSQPNQTGPGVAWHVSMLWANQGRKKDSFKIHWNNLT